MPCSRQCPVKCTPALSVRNSKSLIAFSGPHCRCTTERPTLRRPHCPPCLPLQRRCSQQSLWHLTSPLPASLPSQALPQPLPCCCRQGRKHSRRQSSTLRSLLHRRLLLRSMCAAWPSATWRAWLRGTGAWSAWLYWPRTPLSGGLRGWTGGRDQGATWRWALAAVRMRMNIGSVHMCSVCGACRWMWALCALQLVYPRRVYVDAVCEQFVQPMDAQVIAPCRLLDACSVKVCTMQSGVPPGIQN